MGVAKALKCEINICQGSRNHGKYLPDHGFCVEYRLVRSPVVQAVDDFSGFLDIRKKYGTLHVCSWVMDWTIAFSDNGEKL